MRSGILVRKYKRGDIVIIKLHGTMHYIGLVTEDQDHGDIGYFRVAWHMKTGDWFHSRAQPRTVTYVGSLPEEVEWDL